MDVDFSQDTEDFLEQSGVKGMKWGVRNDKGHEGEQAKTKDIAKLDKKYEKENFGLKGYVKINNAVAAKVNPKLDEMNAKPEYKEAADKGDLLKDTPIRQKYHKEYEKILDDATSAVTNELGTNASGTKQLLVTRYGDGESATWAAYFNDVKHAAAKEGFLIRAKLDAKGLIVGQEIVALPEEALKQSDELTDDFLKHFGVKGMKWGQRSETINAARANRSKFGDATGEAEANYKAQSTAAGKSAALKVLREKEKAEWENDLTAKTLKRGEQLAIALLSVPVTPLVPAAILGAKAAQTSDNRKFKSIYPDDDLKQSEELTEDFLKHFGVKGMKWGKRKGDSAPSPRQQRRAEKREEKQKQTELNKQAERKEADRIIAKSKTEKNPVEAARMRTYSGANATKLKEAKEKYKTEKEELGSWQARKNLDDVKRAVQKDYAKAQEYKDGVEFVNDFIRTATNSAPRNEFATEAERYRQYRNID